MAAPSGGTPLPVVEWALGSIGRQIDAAWINAPAAAALEAALAERSSAGAASAAGSPSARRRALRLTDAVRDSSPLEREYSALFEPVRQARATTHAHCSAPGDAPTLRDVDLRSARLTPAVAVAAALAVDATVVAAGLTACGSALSGAA